MHREWVAKNREYRHRYNAIRWRENKERLREQHKQWRLKNRERRNRYKREWNKTHQESVRRTFEKWIRNNPEKYALSIKKSAFKRRDKIREYMRTYSKRYYKKNKLRILAQTKAYAQSNPEVRRKCRKNWERNHPEKYRAHNAAANCVRKARMRGAKVPKSDINKLIKRWKIQKSFLCYFCGHRFPSSRLHIDHIVAIARGGKHSPDNICKSCDTCNLKKRAKPISKITFLNQKLLAL